MINFLVKETHIKQIKEHMYFLGYVWIGQWMEKLIKLFYWSKN